MARLGLWLLVCAFVGAIGAPAKLLANEPSASPNLGFGSQTLLGGPSVKVDAVYGEPSPPSQNPSTYTAGIRLTLEEGWKVAWKNPGAAGEPFQLKWQTEQNIKATKLHWPLPKRFFIGDLWSIGYEGEVVFPLTVTPQGAGQGEFGQEALLAGEVFFIACKTQCIPIRRSVSLKFPHIGAYQTELIERYARMVPSVEGSLVLSRAELTSSIASNPTLRVYARTTQGAFTSPDLFSEGEGWGNALAPPRVRLRAANSAVFTFRAPDNNPPESVRFILADGDEAVAKELAITRQSHLGWFLALALLGGLILNLMPCVLPVLSLKLAGVIGGATRNIASNFRREFLQSVAGILTSFFLLWAGITVLKLGGAEVGWGFQFQSPQFLAVMAVVMFLFAASMFELVTINLPFNLRASHPFSHGLFATALATPCSAPFVGSAIGFGLASGSSLTALAVFMAMGVGFALPWLAVAAFPQVALWLPKSGNWMVKFKRVLGVLLFATFGWLGYLAYIESGMLVLAIGILLLLGLVFKAKVWFWGLVLVSCLFLKANPLAQTLERSRGVLEDRRVLEQASGQTLGEGSMQADGGQAGAGESLGQGTGKETGRKALEQGSTQTLEQASTSTAPINIASAQDPAQWLRFDEARLQGLVAEGRTVFVDVTAKWCITCMVNKRILVSKQFLTEVARHNIVLMRADWTLGDPRITRWMVEFNRSAVPLNIVFGKNAQGGIILPELLTSKNVLSAIGKAVKRHKAKGAKSKTNPQRAREVK